MGAFTRHADDRALLDYGDFMEALSSAIDAGDAVPLPEDAPGAHGLPEERVKALTKGYGGGPVTGCTLPIDTTEAPSLPPPPPLLDDITAYLPAALPLDHASCFHTERDGTLTFDEIADRLGGTTEARTHLQNWGWQASGFRTFSCGGPPLGEAGWLDIGVHRFASPAAAQQAVDYFAAVRAEGTSLDAVPPPPIGDYQTALRGPAVNGTEYTLYASRGPLLIRVTAVSPSGTPAANVEAVAQGIVAGSASPSSAAPPRIAHLLPSTLPVAHAACFETRADQVLTFDELVSRFGDPEDAASHLRGWGWLTGAYREFTCDTPPDGEAGWLDISVHRFADAAAAQEAARYFADTRASAMSLIRGAAPPLGDLATAVTGPTPHGKEFTLYVSRGPLLIRVTGVSTSGIPFANVLDVTTEVLAAIEA